MVRLFVGLLALASVSGCIYWSPHSLVASDRPIREAVLVGKRVQDRVCNRAVFGVPFGETRASIDDLMEHFHDAAPQATAFQDIRLDEVLSWYVVYSERCLVGSAQPVYPVPTMPARGGDRDGAAPAAPAPPPPAAKPDSAKTPEELEQELLGPTRK
jgi:hypothetical protein